MHLIYYKIKKNTFFSSVLAAKQHNDKAQCQLFANTSTIVRERVIIRQQLSGEDQTLGWTSPQTLPVRRGGEGKEIRHITFPCYQHTAVSFPRCLKRHTSCRSSLLSRQEKTVRYSKGVEPNTIHIQPVPRPHETQTRSLASGSRSANGS